MTDLPRALEGTRQRRFALLRDLPRRCERRLGRARSSLPALRGQIEAPAGTPHRIEPAQPRGLHTITLAMRLPPASWRLRPVSSFIDRRGWSDRSRASLLRGAREGGRERPLLRHRLAASCRESRRVTRSCPRGPLPAADEIASPGWRGNPHVRRPRTDDSDLALPPA